MHAPIFASLKNVKDPVKFSEFLQAFEARIAGGTIAQCSWQVHLHRTASAMDVATRASGLLGELMRILAIHVMHNRCSYIWASGVIQCL